MRLRGVSGVSGVSEVGGVRGPVRDVVVDPEYLDVTVPAGASFSHAIKKGYTVLAYVIEGEGYFDQERNAFAHEVVGSNYFDIKRNCACGAVAPVGRRGLLAACTVVRQHPALVR